MCLSFIRYFYNEDDKELTEKGWFILAQQYLNNQLTVAQISLKNLRWYNNINNGSQ